MKKSTYQLTSVADLDTFDPFTCFFFGLLTFIIRSCNSLYPSRVKVWHIICFLHLFVSTNSNLFLSSDVFSEIRHHAHKRCAYTPFRFTTLTRGGAPRLHWSRFHLADYCWTTIGVHVTTFNQSERCIHFQHVSLHGNSLACWSWIIWTYMVSFDVFTGLYCIQ